MGRDTLNSPDVPLDTRDYVTQCVVFDGEKTNVHDIGMGDTADGRSHPVICWILGVPLGDAVLENEEAWDG